LLGKGLTLSVLREPLECDKCPDSLDDSDGARVDSVSAPLVGVTVALLHAVVSKAMPTTAHVGTRRLDPLCTVIECSWNFDAWPQNQVQVITLSGAV